MIYTIKFAPHNSIFDCKNIALTSSKDGSIMIINIWNK